MALPSPIPQLYSQPLFPLPVPILNPYSPSPIPIPQSSIPLSIPNPHSQSPPLNPPSPTPYLPYTTSDVDFCQHLPQSPTAHYLSRFNTLPGHIRQEASVRQGHGGFQAIFEAFASSQLLGGQRCLPCCCSQLLALPLPTEPANHASCVLGRLSSPRRAGSLEPMGAG